jgi:hypothetical protein
LADLAFSYAPTTVFQTAALAEFLRESASSLSIPGTLADSIENPGRLMARVVPGCAAEA